MDDELDLTIQQILDIADMALILCQKLTDPEQLAFACTQEVQDEARAILKVAKL